MFTLQDNLHWLLEAAMVCRQPPACNELLITITKTAVAKLRRKGKYVHHCVKEEGKSLSLAIELGEAVMW